MSKAVISFLYVPCASEDEAARIARAAVEARLAACGNIVPQMRSIYRWEGKMEEGQEAVLILKTDGTLVEDLRGLVARHHSYKVPCMAELAVESVNAAYAAWLMGEVKSSS